MSPPFQAWLPNAFAGAKGRRRVGVSRVVGCTMTAAPTIWPCVRMWLLKGCCVLLSLPPHRLPRGSNQVLVSCRRASSSTERTSSVRVKEVRSAGAIAAASPLVIAVKTIGVFVRYSIAKMLKACERLLVYGCRGVHQTLKLGTLACVAPANVCSSVCTAFTDQFYRCIN